MYRWIQMLACLVIFCLFLDTDPVKGETDAPIGNISVETVTTTQQIEISSDDIDLIALVTMAEAEGESEDGKRLVIDTILNRVEHAHYPDKVSEVVYQPNQFTSMWNGRVERCSITDEIRELVKEELQERKDHEVIFFTAGEYGRYGTPMFQVGNHYFSSYE